jgi:nitroreductase
LLANQEKGADVARYLFKPLDSFREYPVAEMKARAESFYLDMKRRRTVREYRDSSVPREVIENCIRAAGTAPSGANMQPWHFVVVSDPAIKAKIRAEAEKVEADFYQRRAPESWLKALAPLGTDEHKDYLEKAPYLIVIFSVRHTVADDGTIKKHYYLSESVGIATGMLITAVHNSGLACLTHTPSPMIFLRDILGRPKTESPYLLLVVGLPREGTTVPNIEKKPLDQIATFV